MNPMSSLAACIDLRVAPRAFRAHGRWHRQGFLGAFAAAVIVTHGPAYAATLTLKPTVICTIPVGPDATTNISSSACEECGEGSCFAGFGAVSESEETYFYDLPNGNIKVCGEQGLRTIPGLDPDTFNPVDMTVAAGQIFVLVDQFNQTPRFTIYRRGPESAKWVPIEVVQSPLIGTMPSRSRSGGVVPVRNSVWVYSTIQGDVYLYDLLANQSFPVLKSDNTLAALEQAAGAFRGMMSPTGNSFDPKAVSSTPASEGVPASPPSGGLVLGLDAQGSSYVRRTDSDERTTFFVYRNGEVIGEGEYSPIKTERLTRGKFAQIVGPSGGLFEWLRTKDSLVVRKWSLQ